MKKKYAVIYLDLLGFRDHVGEDYEAATDLLSNFHDVLETRRRNERLQPLSSLSEGPVKRLAERHASDSFNYFIPMSDSVFILSEDPDRVAAQLSTFLLESFLFVAHAYDSSNVIQQPVTDMHITELGTVERHSCQENWYPPLFRGGIAYGEVEVVQTPAIFNGKQACIHNVIGPSVVQAVSLEQSGLSGPRILCDHEFVRHLQRPARNYIRREGNAWELLWPGFNYFEDDDDELESYKLKKLFDPAFYLWQYFSGKPPERHYQAFLELTVRSHLAFAESASDPELVKKYLCQTLNKAGLELCDSALNSQLVFPNTQDRRSKSSRKG